MYSFVVFAADKARAVTLMIEMRSGMAGRIRAEHKPFPFFPDVKGASYTIDTERYMEEDGGREQSSQRGLEFHRDLPDEAEVRCFSWLANDSPASDLCKYLPVGFF
jgi:hypothetical protein